jgi:hypothetical protein
VCSFYIVLGVAASVGPFALTILLRGAAAPWVLLYLSGAYLVAAAFIYRRARGLVRQDLAAAAV